MQSHFSNVLRDASKSWVYHPQSIVVRSPRKDSDFSRRLAKALGAFHQVGLVFHGECAFRLAAFDALSNGEGCWGEVAVDGRQSAFHRQGHFELPALRLLLLEADLVVVDGAIDDGSAVVLELDSAGGGWESLGESARSQVVACVGPRPSYVPPGGVAWFPDQDLDGLVDYLRDHFERKMGERRLWWVLETDESPEHPALAAMVGEWLAANRPVAVRGTCAQQWERLGAVPLGPSSHPGWGKLGALLSLWDFDPSAAFFQVNGVQALDLENLLAQRDAFQFATAYRETQTHLPQTGAVIWEPKSRAKILQSVAAGLSCPQRVLVHARTRLLDR
ncbi:MAG: hypothetical protein IPN71_03600 [Fibrobacteres bacterium]|nr:hypothetical protein [Fibrobacterota bacterium]